MTNKARITYRFDESRHESTLVNSKEIIPLSVDEFAVEQDERPQPVSSQQHTQQPLNTFTTDFGPWKSAFETEADRVEQLIRDLDNQPRQQRPRPQKDERTPFSPADAFAPHMQQLYAEQRPVQQQPEQFVPSAPAVQHAPYLEELPLEEHRYTERFRETGPIVETSSNMRSRGSGWNTRTPWLHLAGAALGAIATGVVIGFTALSLFSSDPEPTVPAGGAPGTAPGTVTGTAPNPASNSSAAAGTIAVHLPAQSYTLLQNGVFSNQQGADTAVADLKAKGLAGVVRPGEKFYVYVGMAANRDAALALSQRLQEGQTELILKPFTIPAVSNIQWAGKQADQVDLYFAQGHSLVQSIATFAAEGLKGQTPPALPDETMQTIRSAHQAWSGAAAAFAEGIPAERQTVVQQMNTAMNTAVSSMEEYKKHASSSYLWQAQTSLMQYMFAEEALLTAIQQS